MKLINLKLLKFIVIIIFFIKPCVVLGNDVEKFANKLFNHYEYDDKINMNDNAKLIVTGGYNVQPTPIHTSIVHDIGLNKIEALISFY